MKKMKKMENHRKRCVSALYVVDSKYNKDDNTKRFLPFGGFICSYILDVLPAVISLCDNRKDRYGNKFRFSWLLFSYRTRESHFQAPPRRGRSSKLVTKEDPPFIFCNCNIYSLSNSRLKNLISGWIDKKNDSYNENIISHNFKLILRGSRDGFSRSVFEERCYNIKNTVVVIKIKETGQLVGGYNPVGWNMKEKSANRRYWIETDDSFIFKINEDQLSDSILSKVGDPGRAIFHDKQNIDITHDDIKFHETTIDFFDLALLISTKNEPYCYYKTNDSYKKNLCISDNTRKVHLVEELEVYQY